MIYEKLQKALDEFPPIVRDGVNPMFKSRYATLDTVIKSVMPTLRKYDIIMSNKVIHENSLHSVEISLIHTKDGEKISTTVPLLNTENMQKLGACITYATRYGLLMLLGLCADEDDDGNHASQSTPRYVKKQPEINIEEVTKLKNELKLKFKDNETAIKLADEDKYNTIKVSLDTDIPLESLKRRLSWIESVIKE